MVNINIQKDAYVLCGDNETELRYVKTALESYGLTGLINRMDRKKSFDSYTLKTELAGDISVGVFYGNR